jgi:putative transposase
LDETYVKVKGSWKYLYRTVDKAGATVDFLLTAKRDCKAALRFLRKAIGHQGAPDKITIDKSAANGDHKLKRKASDGHRNPSGQVSQQHRRTGSPSRQASGPANAGVQIAPVICSNPCRHRTHAHDPRGPIALDGQIASSTAVLLAGGINLFIVPSLSRP